VGLHLGDDPTGDPHQRLGLRRCSIAEQRRGLLEAALLNDHQHAFSDGDVGSLVGQPLGRSGDVLAAAQQTGLGDRDTDLGGQDGPKVLGGGVEGPRRPRVEVEASDACPVATTGSESELCTPV